MRYPQRLRTTARTVNPFRYGVPAFWYDLGDATTLTLLNTTYAGIGTATSTLDSAAVVGVTTQFLVEFTAGDILLTSADVVIGTILSVTDNNNLTLAANAAVAITGAAFKVQKSAPRFTQLNDKSGNGRHLTPNAAERFRPTFIRDDDGKPCLRADGFGDHMLVAGGFTLNQPETVLCVHTPVTSTGNDTLFDGNTGTTMRALQSVGMNITAGSSVTGPVMALGQRTLFQAVFNGASSLARRMAEAPLTGNAGAGNAGGLYVAAIGGAAAGYMDCKIHELLGYDRPLSLGELDEFVAGYRQKYRLAS